MATDTRKRQYEFIQASRGFAAIAVVLFHANATFALDKYFGRGVNDLFGAGDSGVYFFFVISGVVMIIAHHAQIGLVKTPAKFYWKRFIRLYPALWVVLAGLVMILILKPDISAGARLNWLDCIAAFLVIPAEREGLLAVEWTLRHEVLFYAIFGILLWRPKLGATLLALWSAGSLIAISGRFQFPLSFIFSPLHLLFILGIGVGWTIVSKLFWAGPLPLILAAIGLTVFAATWIGVAGGRLDHDSFVAAAAYGVGAAMILSGGVALERRDVIHVHPIFSYFGAASYSIYLVHFPAISLFTKVSMKLEQYVPVSLLFALVVFSATVSGVLFYAFVEKPLSYRLAELGRGNASSMKSPRAPA